jgi:hypothetical protein
MQHPIEEAIPHKLEIWEMMIMTNDLVGMVLCVLASQWGTVIVSAWTRCQ